MTSRFRADPSGASRTTYHEWFDDFDNYTSGDWTNTETGSGSRAVANADGGVLLVTNGASDNDANFFQWQGTTLATTAETFAFTAGKAMLFRTRFKTSDATQTDLVFGLQTTDTTPLATANGIWFQKPDDAATLDFHVAIGSVQTDVTAIATLVSNTYTVLEFYYDGSNSYFQLFKDGVGVGRAAITNAPSVTLTITWGIQNGEAVAKTLSMDYIYVAVER